MDVVWILKKKSKLIQNVVGHVPREITRFIWYFFTRGRNMEVTVLSTPPKPSPIPSGGLETMLKPKLFIDQKHGDILKHLRELIDEYCDQDINDTEKNQGDGDLEF